MPERVVPGPVQDAAGIREAMCIHTKKIFDSCREEDIASYNLLAKGEISRVSGQFGAGSQWAWSSSPWCTR